MWFPYAEAQLVANSDFWNSEGNKKTKITIAKLAFPETAYEKMFKKKKHMKKNQVPIN